MSCTKEYFLQFERQQQMNPKNVIEIKKMVSSQLSIENKLYNSVLFDQLRRQQMIISFIFFPYLEVTSDSAVSSFERQQRKATKLFDLKKMYSSKNSCCFDWPLKIRNHVYFHIFQLSTILPFSIG